jgi:hypothetical protein
MANIFFGGYKKNCILDLLPPESACDSLECQYSSIIFGGVLSKAIVPVVGVDRFFDFGGEVVLTTA